MAASRLAAVAGALALCVGCEAPPPNLVFRAHNLDPDFAPEVEAMARDYAAELGLRIVEWAKPRAGGPDEFSIFLYVDAESEWRDRAVAHLSKPREAESVWLRFSDQAGMAVAGVDELACRLTAEMEARFGIRFCRINPATSRCDEEYQRLEAERLERMRARRAAGDGGGG